MSFQECINEVKQQNCNWKSNSRIIGKAGEIYCFKNIKCVICNSLDWLKCATNEKSKDQICNKCGKKYQIKCKNISERSCKNLKKNRIFKTIGAEYNTTLKSINEEIDYIILLYKKVEYVILDIIHISSDNITHDNIIARKPLGSNAKRAGWQGCNLHFTNINFINSAF